MNGTFLLRHRRSAGRRPPQHPKPVQMRRWPRSMRLLKTSGKAALGLGRVKRENVKLPLEAHSSYRQSVDGNAQVPVPGATSEKFILGIFLLDAFLHSQGQLLPFWQGTVTSAAEGEAAGTEGKRKSVVLTGRTRTTADAAHDKLRRRPVANSSHAVRLVRRLTTPLEPARGLCRA
jgi:hypothetical protein